MALTLFNNVVNQTILQNPLVGSNILNDFYASKPNDPNETFNISTGNQNNSASTNQSVSQIARSNADIVRADNDDAMLSGAVSPEDQLENLAQLTQFVEMSQYERIFWVILFSVMVLVAAGGNTIVIYIVSTNREMKSVTNYFLVNLSLADTMVSTLNVVFNFISMLISHWPFGKIYCKISNFIAILSISASVFTLTAISCDRYNAIIHPLRPRMSHSSALAWILLIWTLSASLAIPNAMYSSLVEDRLTNDNVAVTCTLIWPDGRYPTSSHDHIYNIIILVVTYLVPIITMAILYYKVGKELWGYEAIGENIDKQQRSIMAKKKIVKMMIVVVIIFALCWFPYHGFFVINYYVPTIFQDVPLHFQRYYLIMYWMAMSNSMYNPIIIYFMNSKFRTEFRRILCRLCCCRSYQPPAETRPTNQTHNTTNHNNNNNNNNNNGTSGLGLTVNRSAKSAVGKRQLTAGQSAGCSPNMDKDRAELRGQLGGLEEPPGSGRRRSGQLCPGTGHLLEAANNQRLSSPEEEPFIGVKLNFKTPADTTDWQANGCRKSAIESNGCQLKVWI